MSKTNFVGVILLSTRTEMCEDFAFSKLHLLFSISSDEPANEMTNEKNPIHTKSLSKGERQENGKLCDHCITFLDIKHSHTNRNQVRSTSKI
jgi:hypothetical protein